MNTLDTPLAKIDLKRFPPRKNETLRAWDAADELLLNHLANNDDVLAGPDTSCPHSILIINDAFGALACSLAHWQPLSWGDSYLAHLATHYNAENNSLPSPECLASTIALKGKFDLILIKIPKTLALLEQQLTQLLPHLSTSSKVIAVGMSKYIHTSHSKLFEKYLGPTTTSLAIKKARLIFPTLTDISYVQHSPYPTRYYDNDIQLTLCNHANVFSREKLDIGTRFMLKQYHHLPGIANTPHTIVDLGCGNGVLGIMAKKHYDTLTRYLTKQCQLSFVDESYMALASAKENAVNAFADLSHCQFFVSDSFEQTPLSDVDLIICNPPFHQSHTLGTYIATRMFQHSKQVLKQGGQLWVIANRHLNYATILKKLFGNCRVIDKNNKFVVLAVSLR